jgi:hypothetical protein
LVQVVQVVVVLEEVQLQELLVAQILVVVVEVAQELLLLLGLLAVQA